MRPVKRSPVLRTWGPGEEDVDLFAGGGGASEGKRRATGSSPTIAVNHWPTAIAVHTANHPDCEHYIDDVYKVRPLKATRGKRVRLLWASPTCIYFSRAKGKRLSPATVKIRGLAWSIVPWIKQVRPEVIIVENVVEFESWGPICHQHSDGCAGRRDESGDSCSKSCPYGRPIKSRLGETFRAWEKRIRSFGYSFEFRKIKAWEYGAPTTRERIYIVMRADGKPVEWPEPTHARPEDAERLGRKPWRTAAEIIDWTIPCPSIFDRKTPHVPATRRRVARGMRKFVLEAAKPFLMHLTHGDRHAPHDVDEPVPTVTGANRGEQALAVPYMIHRSNGERPGQAPRVYDVRAPHPTAVGAGIKTAIVTACLVQNYSERRAGEVKAIDVNRPIATVTGQDHHSLVAASLVKYRGTSSGHPGCADIEKPAHTISAGGERGGVHLGLQAAFLARYNGERRPGDASNRLAVTTAFLSRYNGQSIGQHPCAPIGTLDANDRYTVVNAPAAEWSPEIARRARRVYDFLVAEGVIGPWLDHDEQIVRLPGSELVIYDIGMRLLVPRELFRAQGFHDSYIIELMVGRKPVTKTEQVRLAGNSVCPDVAEALVRAALRGTSTHDQLPLRMAA